ncbi:MAG: DUF1566 domain-containing protein [Nitrospirota bacterium]
MRTKVLLVCFVVVVMVTVLSACSGGGGGGGAAVERTTVSIPKTGQTTSYDANTVKADDGALQKGIAWPSPRFTDNGDSTITDNLTGLMWLKDANVIQSHDAATPGSELDNDGTVGDGMVFWQTALDIIEVANASGGHYSDWRLPNRNEMRSLIHYDQTDSSTWLSGQGFQNVPSGFYWTSSSYSASLAFVVYMIDGRLDTFGKAGEYYVWPVRGDGGSAVGALPRTGQPVSHDTNTIQRDDGALRKGVAWKTQRFIVSSSGTGTVVTDSLTGLVWPQEWAAGDGKVPWQTALDTVVTLNTMTYLGHSDWRLPNVNELATLTNTANSNPRTWLIEPAQGFMNIPVSVPVYWTSTTNKSSPSQANVVDMSSGWAGGDLKSNLNLVITVRGGN